MKIKCPICGEMTDYENKQCLYCGSTMANIRKTLLRQKDQALMKENAVYSSKELEELFEFEESGTGFSIKEYLGLENVVFVPPKYKGKAINAISPHAFEGSDVEEVYLSESIRVIMHHSFADCFKLRKIVISARCKVIEHHVFSNCIALKTVSIPESVIEIGKYTFSGCVNLKKVELPERFEIIEEGLFENCSALPYFILPLKLKSIASNAFSNCTGITKIKFNDGLITIGYSAFSGCTALERVLLSETVTTLGEYAFQDCKALKAFYLGKSLADFNGLSFYGCDNLCFFKSSEFNRSFKVSDYGIINIKSDFLIVGGQKTILGNSTKGISEYAFCGTAFFNEIFIPESVISVESNAFYATSNFEIKIEHTQKPKKWSEMWLVGENQVTWSVKK